MTASLSSKSLIVSALATGLLLVGCGGKSASYPDAVAGSGGSPGSGSGGSGTGTGGAGVGTGGAPVSTGGAAGAIAPGDPVPVDRFGSELISATCAMNARCGIYPDVATCMATNWVGSAVLTLQTDVAAGRVMYDPAKAATCLAALRNQPCTITEIAAAATMADPCQGVTTGTVAAGQTCYTSDECVGDALCAPPAAGCTTACCAGTCVAPVASGTSCATAPCAAGSYCRQVSTTTFRCTPKSMVEGAACDAGDACTAPLFCVPDEGGTTGSCVKSLPATGGACNVNSGCNDIFRDYCAGGVCTKMLAVGQPCTPGTDTTPDPCVWYAYCSGGVCKAAGGPGAACTTFTGGGDDCLGAQTCPTAGKTCTAPPAATSCR